MIDRVDPFFGTDTTDLPPPDGLAARWWWPTPHVGNTHPGATYPLGMVSACSYSGAMVPHGSPQAIAEVLDHAVRGMTPDALATREAAARKFAMQFDRVNVFDRLFDDLVVPAEAT